MEMLMSSKLDEFGREVLDSTPMALPVGYKAPLSLNERIRMMVRAEEFRRAVEARGFETIDEADDFEVDDDPDPMPDAPWETVFDPGLGKEIPRQEKQILDQARAEIDEKVQHDKKKKWFSFGKRRVKDSEDEGGEERDPRRSSRAREADRRDRQDVKDASRYREEYPREDREDE